MSDAGQIPQSNALSEADPLSLSELMSRDPEGLSAQDRGRIISALREDRARREAVANDPSAPKKRAPKVDQMIPLDIDKMGL